MRFNFMRFRTFFLAFILLLAINPAWAQSDSAGERITDFHSDIEVQKDASVVVTERIAVVSEGYQIRHGIFRDIPTQYRDRFGNRYRVGMDVLQATRDGRQESWRVEDKDNGIRIYLGSSSFMLPPGPHEYTITYRTTRQLGFFNDHDEIYWNVTGNGWIFPIDHASATVHLPKSFSRDDLRLDAYTGLQGVKGRDFRVSFAGDSPEFSTTFPLQSREGLTIAVGFPKGYVTEPTQQQKMEYFFQDNRTALYAVAGFLFILIYYSVVWFAVGRDPKAGDVTIQYIPPTGFSPAAIRNLVKMDFDSKAVAATVVNLAVNGQLTIRQEDEEYILQKKQPAASSSALAPEEKALFEALFRDGDTLHLDKIAYLRVRPAVQKMSHSLALALEKVYFLRNSRYFIPGVIFSACTLIAVAWTRAPQMRFVSIFSAFWLTFWTFGVVGLIAADVKAWRSFFKTRHVSLLFPALVASCFTVPFLAGEGFGIFLFSTSVSIAAVPVLLGMVFLNILFYQLLKAPTHAGREVLDKIEGFKQYLNASSLGREYSVEGSQQTPETFEKYLPYAMALDMESEWASNFSLSLGAAAAGGSNTPYYVPIWYVGPHPQWARNFSGFASDFGSSFSTAIASSASAPGSSSGGGGGGSSGGGGGGGGGGGW